MESTSGPGLTREHLQSDLSSCWQRAQAIVQLHCQPSLCVVMSRAAPVLWLFLWAPLCQEARPVPCLEAQWAILCSQQHLEQIKHFSSRGFYLSKLL